MHPITHPKDGVRLANQRGAELQRIAAQERLAVQLRADRRTERPTSTKLADPIWRRRVLAASAFVGIAIAIGIGTPSNWADHSNAGMAEPVVDTCDHSDDC